MKTGGPSIGLPNIPFAKIAGVGVKIAEIPVNQLTAKASMIPRAGAAVLDLAGLDTPAKVAKNAATEVVEIPAQAVPSTYHLGTTAVHDPVKAGKMLADPYVQTVKHPVKSFVEHPVGTALIASGIEGAAGRVAGAGMRAIPGATRRLASTERAPKTFPNSALREDRTYSKDPIRKVGQKVYERVGRGAHAEQFRGTNLTQHDVHRRVDETFAADEDIRRIEREQTRKHVRDTVGKDPSPAVVLGVQNIATDAKSARAYRQRVAAEGEKLKARKSGAQGASKVAQNKATLDFLDTAIRDFEQNPKQIRDAIDSYKQFSVAQQTKLGGLYGQGARLEMRRLMPYAVTHMGAHMRDGEFVDAAGRKLTPDAIRSHMSDEYSGPGRVSEPAFISHAPGMSDRSSFYVPTTKPAVIGPHGTTGAAVAQGTLDLHPKSLEQNAVKAQALVTTAQRFGRFIEEFGQRARNGDLSTFSGYRDAKQRAMDWNTEHPDSQVRPVRINPAGNKEQLDELLDRINSGEVTRETALKNIQDALESTDGEGPWALIPDSAAERAVEHMKSQTIGTAANVLNLVGSQFRRTVLSLSPRWMRDNGVEAALRSMVAGVGPQSYRLGKKSLNRLEELDPQRAAEARARITPGGVGGIQRRNAIYTDAERFAGTKLAGLATKLGKFWRTPGPKQLAHTWHAYTDFVFNVLNGKMEGAVQTAMLGRELKRSPLMSNHLVKTSKAAVDDAANGLLNTNNQVAFGRAVDTMYGRYSKYSPNMRRAIATTTPFISWYLNALKFIFKTLPKDHPVVTSLLASSHEATQEWLNDKGLNHFLHNGALPDWLQGLIPLADGSHSTILRGTPFNVMGNPLQTGVGEFMPQWTGIMNNLQGEDWKGQPLPNRGTPLAWPTNLLYGATSLIEGTIPLASIPIEAVQKGTSVSQEAVRQKNPLYAYPPGKQTSGSNDNPFKSSGNPYKSTPSSDNPFRTPKKSLSGSNPYK